jgi:glutathione S-transferase
MTIQLWHCQNARSFRVLWALEEIGAEYDLHMLCFPPRVNNKDYLEENPLGTVPFLRDGDVEMTESAAMLQYLADRYDPLGAGRPSDHVDFGAYLNWLHHGEATLTFPLAIALRYARFEPDERKQPQVAADYTEWFLARLRKAEATLSDGRAALLPSGFSMADISVAYAVQLAITMGLRDQLPPNVIRWFAGLTKRPAFIRTREIEEHGHIKAGYPARLPVPLP